MTLTRRLLTLAALSSSLVLAACGGGSGPSGQSAFERANDRALGNPDAPLTVIEYSSVACPHCATFHNNAFKDIEENYIETGQVRFVFREMLTGQPQFAVAGFALANCVQDDRYFDMIELLFQQQNAIFRAASQPGGARNQYLTIARTMGMSEADFEACLANEDIQAAIIERSEQASADGVNATPYFIINGFHLDARVAPGETSQTYFLGENQILVDGESVPADTRPETYARIFDHLLAQIADTQGAAE
ncbi:DsbA family protein [Maricaulis sp. D1M11]|uniref:DsbA family protein n=1 Tax=Maricaulis sp. D1M11 TaxID=3076117 RepID=UPI0039B5A186